jgi:hypothetical protein
MEKKIIGILLTLGGVTGLILAAWYLLNASSGVRDIKLICIYGVLGIIFFFAGVGLIRSTKEKT